ncbi:FAD-dependent oxidoreductase [Kocuria carniphila]|uniref:FAD-dependent oxidoreductase n=1 Tax=Kocuria carniphila TaxID=262208 RepID=A0ABV3V2L3_9MICC
MMVDTVIIGGGIAGLSLASEFADCRGSGEGITLVEAETALAHHTSSRSAQQLIPSYGPEPVLELTRLTIPALVKPTRAAPVPLAWPSPFVVAGSPADVASMTVPGLRALWSEELFEYCPELAGNPERYSAAIIDDSAVRTNATALVEWHRQRAEQAGVRILTGAKVTAAKPSDDGTWALTVGDDQLIAHTVVNAAGAWADHVAELFGAVPQQLQPLRRTAALVSLSEPLGATHPMVDDAGSGWYYRPDEDGAMISWGEAEPSPACDAQPRPNAIDDLIATVERETSLTVTGVRKAWTGLRTEAPSGVPICGWDPQVSNFLWLAGQGGYGFQTSSAMARAATDLLVDGRIEDWLSADTAAALQPQPIST